MENMNVNTQNTMGTIDAAITLPVITAKTTLGELLAALTEDETEVKTETLSIKATALPDGLVKSKTCENTDEMTYNNWYKSVYIPVTTATAKSASSAKSAS